MWMFSTRYNLPDIGQEWLLSLKRFSSWLNSTRSFPPEHIVAKSNREKPKSKHFFPPYDNYTQAKNEWRYSHTSYSETASTERQEKYSKN